VNVSSFKGEVNQDLVQLSWETGNEHDLIGFNIYRSESPTGEKEKLNNVLVQAKHPGQMMGAEYQFTHKIKSGKSYYYWLEWVGEDGAELEGPVWVETDYLLYMPVLTH
jgi:hypothetical protein